MDESILCNPSDKRKWLPIWLPLGIGVLVVIIIKLLAFKARSLKLRPLRERLLHRIFTIGTPIMTLFGCIIFIVDDLTPYGSFVICSDYVSSEITIFSFLKLLMFIVRCFFIFRVFFVWTIYWYVELFISIINTFLFVQDAIAIITGQRMIAFQFLFLLNLYSFETKPIILGGIKYIAPNFEPFWRILLRVLVVTMLLAGFLRAAEEWNTNDGFNPELGILPEKMGTLASYMYWIFITISTVGFGDMTPNTIAGQFILVIATCTTVMWFSEVIAKLPRYILQPLEENSGQSCDLLVVGCKERYQLVDFMHFLPFLEPPEVHVYVDGKDLDISNMAEQLGLKTLQGVNTKEAMRSIMSPSPKECVIFILRDPTLTQLEADQCSLDLLRSIKGYFWEATILLEASQFLSQKLSRKINGWNPNTDVCISLETISAHILALSAHSRLAPALVCPDFVKQLIYAEVNETGGDYFAILKEEYFIKGRVLVAAVGDQNETILMPDEVKPNWTPIFLNPNKVTMESTQNKSQWTGYELLPNIITSAISSSVAVLGQSNTEVLNQALICHNVTQVDSPLVSNFVLTSNNVVDLLKVKQEIPKSGRIISTLAHGYELCNPFNSKCICGSYNITKLPMKLLGTAYHDRHFYDIWMKLITENYLHAEVIEEDCMYGDLFRQLVSRRRVPLGVEINLCESNSMRCPLLSPVANLRLDAGDIVLYMQKPISYE